MRPILLALVLMIPLAAAAPTLEGTLTDPASDTATSVSGKDVPGPDRPPVDIVSIETRVEGDSIVQTMTLSGAPLTSNYRYEISNWMAANALATNNLLVAHHNHGGLKESSGSVRGASGLAQPVAVEVTIEGNTIAWRFAASAVPAEAKCWSPHGLAQDRSSSEWVVDRAALSPDPCAASNATPTPTPTSASTPASPSPAASTPTAERATAPPSPRAATTTTSGETESDTPAPALAAVLATLAVVAVLRSR